MLIKRWRRIAAGCVLQSCWAVAICTALWAQSGGNDYLVTTVAGNGNSGFTGDGGLARYAQLANPGGLAIDSSGNLFIADTGNNRIRKVTPDGKITTIAGTGSPGFSGDGGPAISAQLSSPLAVAVDQIGNVYVLDSSYPPGVAVPGFATSRVRRITPDGRIEAFAGDPRLSMLDGGPATSTNIGQAFALTADSQGNLYIAHSITDRGANSGASVIRKVTRTGTISTVAGPSSATPLPVTPIAMISDTAGTLYFVSGGGSIRKLAPNGTLSEIVIPGLGSAIGVAIDASGSLYVGDGVYHKILRRTQVGAVTTVAGGGSMLVGDGGPANAVTLIGPQTLTADSAGNVFFTEVEGRYTNRVRKAILAPATSGCNYSLDSSIGASNQRFGPAGGGGSIGVQIGRAHV